MESKSAERLVLNTPGIKCVSFSGFICNVSARFFTNESKLAASTDGSGKYFLGLSVAVNELTAFAILERLV